MKPKSYIFWIRSNKGTDLQQVVRIEGSLKKSGIKEALENWCSGSGAWNHSDNTIHYGWIEANKTNLKSLSRYYEGKQARYKQTDALIKKAITTQGFNDWLTKNKKKLSFPFK